MSTGEKAEGKRYLDPFEIRFAQESIYPAFLDKSTFEDAIKKMDFEYTSKESNSEFDILIHAPFPDISVVWWKPKIRDEFGKPIENNNEDSDGSQYLYGEEGWFSTDNRRLHVLQRVCAAYPQYKCGVQVDVAKLTEGFKKFRTRTDGHSVKLAKRKGMGRDNIAETFSVWDPRQAIQHVRTVYERGFTHPLQLQAAAALDCASWEYQGDDKIQGPFSMKQMEEWYVNDCLDEDLLVRRHKQDIYFFPLREYFKLYYNDRYGPEFESPTPFTDMMVDDIDFNLFLQHDQPERNLTELLEERFLHGFSPIVQREKPPAREVPAPEENPKKRSSSGSHRIPPPGINSSRTPPIELPPGLDYHLKSAWNQNPLERWREILEKGGYMQFKDNQWSIRQEDTTLPVSSNSGSEPQRPRLQEKYNRPSVSSTEFAIKSPLGARVSELAHLSQSRNTSPEKGDTINWNDQKWNSWHNAWDQKNEIKAHEINQMDWNGPEAAWGPFEQKESSDSSRLPIITQEYQSTGNDKEIRTHEEKDSWKGWTAQWEASKELDSRTHQTKGSERQLPSQPWDVQHTQVDVVSAEKDTSRWNSWDHASSREKELSSHWSTGKDDPAPIQKESSSQWNSWKDTTVSQDREVSSSADRRDTGARSVDRVSIMKSKEPDWKHTAWDEVYKEKHNVHRSSESSSLESIPENTKELKGSPVQSTVVDWGAAWSKDGEKDSAKQTSTWKNSTQWKKDEEKDKISETSTWKNTSQWKNDEKENESTRENNTSQWNADKTQNNTWDHPSKEWNNTPMVPSTTEVRISSPSTEWKDSLYPQTSYYPTWTKGKNTILSPSGDSTNPSTTPGQTPQPTPRPYVAYDNKSQDWVQSWNSGWSNTKRWEVPPINDIPLVSDWQSSKPVEDTPRMPRGRDPIITNTPSASRAGTPEKKLRQSVEWNQSWKNESPPTKSSTPEVSNTDWGSSWKNESSVTNKPEVSNTEWGSSWKHESPPPKSITPEVLNTEWGSSWKNESSVTNKPEVLNTEWGSSWKNESSVTNKPEVLNTEWGSSWKNEYPPTKNSTPEPSDNTWSNHGTSWNNTKEWNDETWTVTPPASVPQTPEITSSWKKESNQWDANTQNQWQTDWQKESPPSVEPHTNEQSSRKGWSEWKKEEKTPSSDNWNEEKKEEGDEKKINTAVDWGAAWKK